MSANGSAVDEAVDLEPNEKPSLATAGVFAPKEKPVDVLEVLELATAAGVVEVMDFGAVVPNENPPDVLGAPLLVELFVDPNEKPALADFGVDATGAGVFNENPGAAGFEVPKVKPLPEDGAAVPGFAPKVKLAMITKLLLLKLPPAGPTFVYNIIIYRT